MLNDEQRLAAQHIDGPLLIIAGAGSGKTRVVTERICHLIDQGISPDQILGLTFTNKAAGEMRSRVRSQTHSDVLISTFHSLGARILRESISSLGYKSDFSIYDEEDVLKVLKAALEDLGTTAVKADLKSFRSKISRAKNALQKPEEMDNSDAHRYLDRAVPTVYDAYQKRMQKYNAVDFDDLLYLTVRLFQEHPDVLEKYKERWRYLLIDEYQDTNAAQYRMSRLLVEQRQNICVVGDPDQSIYSWRGADIDNILNFEKDFKDVKVVRLEQNYRSTNTILEASNAVIQQNSKRLEKHLWSDLGEGEKIRIHRAIDEKYETRFILDAIEQNLNAGIPLSQMVIFYRTNAQSRPFEDKLLARGIPYTIVGGLSFYQRREIKDILAFLRMIQSGSDFVSFERTVNLPKRGVGQSSLEKLRAASFDANLPIIEYCHQLIDGQQFNIKLTPKLKKGLQSYLAIIEKFKARIGKESLGSLITSLIQESGYFQHLMLDEETFEDRKENLLELINKATEWEKDNPDAPLEQFLEELTLKSTLDEVKDEMDHLSLMTLHNGKGLEYQVTFMSGMEEGLFPHINSHDNETAMEEERRLCYVGMTRAKKILYMTYAEVRSLFGQTKYQRASRFLKEIPREFIKKVVC